MSGDEYQWHYDYARLAFDTGFRFETSRSKCLDKIIGHINVEQIIRERDVVTIERYIPAVVEFCLDNDQTSILDPTFVKIFHLTQLSVQYLLFCKKYLDNSVVLIKQEYQKSNEENKNLKRQIEELCQETSNYKKQIKELKSTLNCQITNQNIGIFQCQECPKAFSTEEFLLAHVKRRHESLGIIVAPSNTTFQAETDKLQLEIKQLKERLNSTERFVSHNEFAAIKEYSSKSNPQQNTFVTELQEKFEDLKVHVDNELKVLQTQKFEKEKYEKWFEAFLSKKLAVSNNSNSINDKPVTTTTGTQGEIVANNCSTQTESLALPTPFVCENCLYKEQFPARVDSQNNLKNQTEKVIYNTEELQQKLHLETQNRLQKFEELLEEKVSGSMEKLENQMQTFFVKINDMEEQRVKTNTSVESVKEITSKTSKPRKQTTSPIIRVAKSAEQIINREGVSPKKAAVRSNNAVLTIKKLSSSSSESEDESESTDSDTDEDNQHIVINKPVVKISATSTLGRRSLTSLKEVAFTPKVLEQLQKEIEKAMQNRLQEVGVNPKATGISVRPYQRALGIVSHQASIIQKNVSNYMQIRRQILKDVDIQSKQHSKPKNSKLKSLLNNFRNYKNDQQKSQTSQVRNNDPVDLSDSESDTSLSNRSNKIILQNVVSSAKRLYSSDSESSRNPVNTTSTAKPFVVPTNDTDAQTKGVLKNHPVVGFVPKKKVLFDLDSALSKENVKPVTQNKMGEGGSTTSIASSVLDGSKTSLAETQRPLEKKKPDVYDSSDWELSEISTN